MKKPNRLFQPGKTTLIILVAVFLSLFANAAFFAKLLQSYPFNLSNVPFLASAAILLPAVTTLLLALVCHKFTIKPVLITLLLVSALSAYFMDSYNVIIDDTMLNNVANTDTREVLDLLNIKLFLYLLLIGIIPALYVLKSRIVYKSFGKELIASLKLIAICLVVILGLLIAFSSNYASYFREHKYLRYYANPGGMIYAAFKYVKSGLDTKPDGLQPIGVDAHIPATDEERELILFVVGETARADRFSLNGYERQTNPLLEKEDVISFDNFWACGTSTAVSVPCMFSIYNQAEFNDKKADTTENLLDVLNHAGIDVLWLDNNSDSKGVALRVPYQNYRSPDINPDCDLECRDDGMLMHIKEHIEAHPQGDIFIILHQMGNHGPAYYKRYPESFEKFSPVCKTNELGNCSREEIDNAYDNSILYTDYFLAQAIDLLKQYDEDFETALFYVSDHGESLGEGKLYLHGLPPVIAPDEQLRVPAIMWFGKGYDDISRETLRAKASRKFNHDNIFHTVLGLMEIESEVYDANLDIIHGAISR